MRKIFTLFLAGALFTACIDKDYDLENIETDNVTIGGDESEFRIPLASVRVSLSEIASEGNNIQKIFAEADVWLPSQLPGSDSNGTYADLVKLAGNTDGYTDGLLDALIAQMLTDDNKINAVAELLCDDKYFDTFREMLHLPAGTQPETFIPLFTETFRTQETLREELSTEVKNLARGYLTTMDVELPDYDVGKVDISDDVVDMLAGNLNAGNTLDLYGEIANELPVTLQIDPIFTPTDVSFHVNVKANTADNEIKPTRLTEENLRQIIAGIQIKIPIELQKYYPGKGFQENIDHQIVINLRLLKKGGLKLDI